MIIYKKYNKQELDLQYNNRHHVPDFENSLQLWETLSRLAEKRFTNIKDIAYGEEPRECLDVFPSAKPNSKTLVFIHGGYWQKFDKSNFHFIAGAFADHGISTVIINYPLMPAVSMDKVVTSCRKAVGWIHKNIIDFHGDPEQIFIAGHSAGAHLAAMLLTTEETQNNLSFIKGICGFSGVFDLIPIQLSNINDVLQMDKETAIRNSPALMAPNHICPLLIAAGGAETNEFLDQSRELYKNWKAKIPAIELIEIPGLNHFTILDSIVDRMSALHQSICKLMMI
jgi:arylformamidase